MTSPSKEARKTFTRGDQPMTSPTKESMRIWTQVWRTDPDNTKDVKKFGGITSVDLYSRIKTATELWGPVGDGWGWSCEFELQELPSGEILVICFMDMWYETRAQRISAVGTSLLVEKGKDGLRTNINAHKSAQSSGLAKCLSMLGWNYDVYSGLWDQAGHRDEMREYYRSRKLYSSCPHLNESEDTVRRLWDKIDCMRAISEMARCVTTHVSWFTHHVKTTKPEWMTDDKPNDLVSFTYCVNLFLKVQRRTAILHKLMQAYENRGHWLQTLHVMDGEDPYLLTDKKFDSLTKKIRADVSGIDEDRDRAEAEGREDEEQGGGDEG